MEKFTSDFHIFIVAVFFTTGMAFRDREYIEQAVLRATRGEWLEPERKVTVSNVVNGEFLSLMAHSEMDGEQRENIIAAWKSVVSVVYQEAA